MISCTPSSGLRVLLASAAFLTATLLAQAPAMAQTPPPPRLQPNITTLLNSGYTIAAASSSGLSQFIYLQGADTAGRKKAYACQLQFGPGGGFRGCLVLP
ncbi:MAG TPA: hypothetical protein VMU56_00130 [Beijerinckiaceae bacterium]|nr:hypothetical protein [Beijerinckiaceae bacterium]